MVAGALTGSQTKPSRPSPSGQLIQTILPSLLSRFRRGNIEAAKQLIAGTHVLKLTRGITAQGLVVDTKGHPVPGVKVQAFADIDEESLRPRLAKDQGNMIRRAGPDRNDQPGRRHVYSDWLQAGNEPVSRGGARFCLDQPANYSHKQSRFAAVRLKPRTCPQIARAGRQRTSCDQ